MTTFPALAKYFPIQGAVSLTETDSADIALANVLTGLSHMSEQDDFKVFVESESLPILAFPALPLEIEDEDVRCLLLVEDIILKLSQWTIPEGTLGIVFTGPNAEKCTRLTVDQLEINPIVTLEAFTTSEALELLEAESLNDSAPDYWLWVSAHAGCSQKLLLQQSAELACAKNSEGTLAADAAVAVLLSKQPNRQTNPIIGREIEPFSETPMDAPTEALQKLMQHILNAEVRPILHSFNNRTESSIELYKLEQYLNTNRINQEPEPWAIPNIGVTSMTPVLGELGVCTVPLQLLFQLHWSLDTKPIMIATENNARIIWCLNNKSDQGSNGQ
ncbi:hypothetical protein KO489_00420 [Reinekea forsetii]|nr:hypothetical protein [Reinekea forsetii]